MKPNSASRAYRIGLIALVYCLLSSVTSSGRDCKWIQTIDKDWICIQQEEPRNKVFEIGSKESLLYWQLLEQQNQNQILRDLEFNLLYGN